MHTNHSFEREPAMSNEKRKWSWARRDVLVGASLVATALMMPGAASAQQQLVISHWGFNGEKLQELLFKPFEEKYGVKIVLETGNNADRLNKIRIRGDVPVDIIYLADSFAQTAIDLGLVDTIDRSKIPNIADLYDIAKAPHGEAYGPAYTVGRLGIVYNSAAVSAPITQWSDLWREELKGKLTIPQITTTFGPLMVVIAGNKVGVDAFANPDAAFASLKTLSEGVVSAYGRSSELINMFNQGEVVAAATQDFVFATIKKANPAAVWADLSDGAYANLNTINIVKGSPNKELAEAFINWALDPAVQKALAVAKVDAPANTKVVLTPEEAAQWTYGEAVINSLHSPDYGKLSAALPDWTQRWNDAVRQ
jgi:putative spermidine/putrescine transport system substrate-binding protein